MAPRPPEGHALFETPIGTCAVAWSARGIRHLKLPHGSPEETRQQLLEAAGDLPEVSPPRAVAAALECLVRLLSGRAEDLRGVTLDLDGTPPFHRAVYEALREVPRGETVTYAELAGLAGSPGASRAVGAAMARNPIPLLVPCHRVVAAGGRPGGWSGPGGLAMKERLLGIEGTVASGSGFAPRRAATRRARPVAAGKTQRARTRRRRLPYDPVEATAALAVADPALGRLIARVGPLGLEPRTARTPFESLVRSIAYQQLTGKAAATILERVKALFPPPFPTPEAVLEIDEEALRGAGLSRPKVAALRDLAARTLDGTVPTLRRLRRMADDELVERLVKVRGIGRWSVEMFLIFSLGRPDVLPVDDYGVRKGFAATFGGDGLPDRGTLQARGERWRPWRSVASWYLWRAAEGL